MYFINYNCLAFTCKVKPQMNKDGNGILAFTNIKCVGNTVAAYSLGRYVFSLELPT